MTPWPAVAPKSEIKTIFRFDHLVKASLSGCVEAIPALFSFAKIGDSFIFSRTYREISTRKMEIRNGMRQPYAVKSSFDIEFWVTRITMSETKRPSVAVI